MRRTARGRQYLPQRSIEADTGIMVDVVAEAVWEEARRLLDQDLPQEYVPGLAAQAEGLYLNSASFAKRIRSNARRGNAGRDWLYAFMRHWLASMIRAQSAELARKLPGRWVMGEMEGGK